MSTVDVFRVSFMFSLKFHFFFLLCVALCTMNGYAYNLLLRSVKQKLNLHENVLRYSAGYSQEQLIVLQSITLKSLILIQKNTYRVPIMGRNGSYIK